MQEYRTTTEVAKYYRTADATVRYWRHVGKGPRGVKVGRRVLYPTNEIERYDAELMQEAGHAAFSGKGEVG
jgi:hypothetical protein